MAEPPPPPLETPNEPTVPGERHEDPIVAEVRRVREELAARFDYDLDLIFEHARRRTEARRAASGTATPPRRPSGNAGREKKAG